MTTARTVPRVTSWPRRAAHAALAASVVALLGFGPSTSAATAGPPAWAKGPAEKACQHAETTIRGQGPSCRVGAGLWKVRLRNGETVLTHGPDAAPDISAAATVSTPRHPVCQSASPNGNYGFVAILAWPAGATPNETDASLRARLHGIDGALYDSAVESGSPGGADYVYACDAVGQVRVDRVELPTPAGSASFSTILSDLKARGYNNSNEKYVVWYDAPMSLICGTATLYFDERATAANFNNIGPDWAVAFDCDSLMHESGHTIGAVQQGSPYSTGDGGHCWQEYDVMCYADGGNRYPGSLVYSCTDREHFDCLHNDYFDAKIGAGQGGAAGSYLDTHWNLAQCEDRFVVNYACPGTAPLAAGYRTAVLSHSPAAYWRLGESSGTSAADESGHAKTASYLNGVALGQPGALSDGNTAASFDGLDDQLSAPSLGLSGPFTIELWAFLRGPGSSGATGYDSLLGYDWSHRLLWNPSAGTLLAQFDGNFVSTLAVSAGAWHHIVYSFDGASERFYVDGQAAGAHATTLPVWNQPFRLGSFDAGPHYKLNGVLDEVALYGRALSAAEVQADFASAGRYRAGVIAAAPAAYWRLGESSGTSAADESGHAKTASYLNGVALGQPGALSDGNTAASFDGLDDQLSAPSLGLSGPFTIELWAFLRGPGSSGATGYDSLLGYDWSHRLLWNPSAGTLLAQFDGNFVSTLAVSAGAWHHIVYSFDGASERFYVDGQAAGAHATTLPVWNQPFRLGSFDAGPHYKLNGVLDEVALYGRALSATEVQAHYANR